MLAALLCNLPVPGPPKQRPKPSKWREYDIVDERHAIVDGSTVDVFKETPTEIKVKRVVNALRVHKIEGFKILHKFDPKTTDVVKRVLQLRAYVKAIEKLKEVQQREEEEALVALLLEI